MMTKQIRNKNFIVILLGLVITMIVCLFSFFTRNTIWKDMYIYHDMPIWIFIFGVFLVLFMGTVICFLIFIKNFLLNKDLHFIETELKDNLIFKYENKISKKITTIVLISELMLEKITKKNIDKNFASDIYLTEKSIIMVLNCCILKTFKYEDIDKILCYLSGKNICISILGNNNKSDILMSVPADNNNLKQQENTLMNLILSKNSKIVRCKDTYENEVK